MLLRSLPYVLLGLLAACSFSPDPDKGLFKCTSNPDCGDGYTCVEQRDGTNRSLCYKTRDISQETCNGVDDDKDGVVDNGFDLTTDAKNCGACGHACSDGTTCAQSVCVEVACSDGLDNDGDGKIDCLDPDCLGQACDAQDADKNCGLDGRQPKQLACVKREKNCSDGLDNDGDGKIDCADPDCDGRECKQGSVCAARACPP